MSNVTPIRAYQAPAGQQGGMPRMLAERAAIGIIKALHAFPHCSFGGDRGSVTLTKNRDGSYTCVATCVDADGSERSCASRADLRAWLVEWLPRTRPARD